jgi:hypothetical protein
MADRYGAVRNGQGKGISKATLPLLAVVIRKHNGVRSRFIKIRMDGPTGLRWIQYARWWWEENVGAVPPGKMVLHLNGRSMDDRPKNLGLGGPADKVLIAHRDPEWSRRQHETAAAACGEFNRFNGKLNRLRNILKLYWYPVLDSEGIVFGVPFRRRKTLLAWFGVDVSAYPSNGQAKKLIEKLGQSTIRPVRGVDLESGMLGTYPRIDPEFEVGARGDLPDEIRNRVSVLKGTDLWKRAEAAAKLDLSSRG